MGKGAHDCAQNTITLAALHLPWRIVSFYLVKQPQGSATPGDGLFRISCDYATGVAGVLRTLHRYTHLAEADFVLDEVVSMPKELDESSLADRVRTATSTMR